MQRDVPFPPFSLPRVDVVERYGVPQSVVFCRKCVVSNQRPRIAFDADGLCGACQFAEVKRTKIDWRQRELELEQLCDRHRRGDGRFDVVVPSSGGKDSGFVSHLLKTKFGMRPLTVTWAPHWYTDIGHENLQSLIHSGFDNMCFTPNGVVHRVLTRLAFIHLADPFQPFIYGQKNFPISIAASLGIPLVMYGENGEVEYGGDMKNAFSPTHNLSDDIVKHYFSGVAPEDWTKFGVDERDLQAYRAPPLADLTRVGVECHFMGYYQRWIPQELFYYCSENTGFKANHDGRSEGTYSKYAGLDDRLDGFHYYMAFIKFGLGRCTSDSAHEIRDAHITREEGVALVKRFDGEFPAKYFEDFLHYTGLTSEQFESVVDAWRPPHLWAREGDKWHLQRAVWHESTPGVGTNPAVAASARPA